MGKDAACERLLLAYFNFDLRICEPVGNNKAGKV